MATKAKAEQFRVEDIRPALQVIGLWSASMEELLLGTALAESDLFYRKQFPKGPGRSYFQMELLTHDDIWANYLKYHPKFATAITSLMTSPAADKHEELEKNNQYAAALAGIHYVRNHVKLPKSGDTMALADCWVNIYNRGGKADQKRYIDVWNKTMGSK